VTYLLPLLPQSKRLRRLKDRELHLIGRQLDDVYTELSRFDRERLETCEALRKLSRRTEQAPTFPPVQGRAYETMAVSTLLTQLPNAPALFKYIATLLQKTGLS